MGLSFSLTLSLHAFPLMAACHSLFQRLIPIQDACTATQESILEHLAPLFDTSLEPNKSYAIALEVRNNGPMKADKMKVIDAAAALVGSKCPVKLKDMEQSVMISVLGKAALLGVVTDYPSVFGLNLQKSLERK